MVEQLNLNPGKLGLNHFELLNTAVVFKQQFQSCYCGGHPCKKGFQRTKMKHYAVQGVLLHTPNPMDDV